MREILFQNAILTVRSLNLFLALGFLFTGTYVIRYVERHKMNMEFLTKNLITVLVATLLSGRLIYTIANYASFLENPFSIIYIWDLNFNFFGMIAGATLTLYLLCKKADEDFGTWFDTFVLSSLGMLIFLHVGYFFSGQNYGLPTELPWGISFEANHIPFVSDIHPTQLYAALTAALLLIYSNISSKRTHLSGVVGTRAILIYSLMMLGINFLHGDPSLYVKIAYGVTATIGFVSHVHCTHKTHITS